MISLKRVLNLRDLEVYLVFKDEHVLSYAIIEDTKKPFTNQDIKLEPLCLWMKKILTKLLMFLEFIL